MMKLYSGCVEDRNDPLKMGRCKVRIVGLHTESKVSLPTDDLPWAYPISPITSAGTSGIGTAPLGPVEGTWVLITFMDPDEQMPMMLGTMLGVYQTPEALATGQFTINEADPAGNVDLTNSPSIAQNPDGTPGDAATSGTSYGGGVKAQDGKVVTDKAKIVGPLGALISKAESGTDGYNAYNKGTVNGKIVGKTKNIDLTKMPIKDIMARQALPSGDPNKMFAVGKYQCIPDTLKAACKALNIDVNQPFDEKCQDIICQEYLISKKRPPLVAYYRNPDKSNEKLLMNAGQSLAAEFASIEDPYFLGFPYKGPKGRYYKSGNRAHTKWSKIKKMLQAEWEFRNNKTSPPPTATIAANDKIDKGTDYSGVSKLVPPDDSVATPPKSSAGSSAGDAPDIPETPALPDTPAPSSLPLTTGSVSLSESSSARADIQSQIGGELGGLVSQVSGSFAELTSSLNLNGAIGDLIGGLSTITQSLLSSFGSTLNEVSENLGIPNVTGSVTELANNLGLVNPSQETIVAELAKKAGSSQGQAAAIKAKLDAEGEPTKPVIAPLGEKNADGSVSNGTGVDPTVGFQDPNGVYPKYKNEPDTNRLATGNNLGRTIVLDKEATRKTDIRIANGGTFDQPAIPYNAKYPFNKVTQTESGHIQEWDDTPGFERVHTYHKSGTFTEIDASGSQVNRIVGDGFEIMERNGFIYVKGGYCVTVEGSLNLRTDSVFNLEVSGAANVKIYSDANVDISGNCNLAVGATLNAKASSINLESVNQMNIKAGTGLNIEAGKDINFKSFASINTQAEGNINNKALGGIFSDATGDIHQKAKGVFNAQATGDANVKSAANVNVQAATDANVKAGANTNIEAGSEASVKAGGAAKIDGSVVDLAVFPNFWNGANSAGDAADSEPAAEAREASFAELELPVETRGTSGIDVLPALAVSSRGAEVGFDSPDSGDASSYINQRVATNQSSASDIGSTRFESQTNAPSATSASSPSLPASYNETANMSTDQFTAGMKISKHFTLGQLTAGGTRIPRVTYNVKGENFTPQQIVANLSNLATNVLDPIYEKYGAFTITSGFRRPPHGSHPGDLGGGKKEGGDHPRGCAADIKFTKSKQETFNVCNEIVKILPAWNQIIMEYDGSSCWIHVALHPSGNKGHMFTMVNHHKYRDTYPKGGFALV